MKQFFSTLILVMIAIMTPLFASIYNWETFTNTNHIFDFNYSDNRLSIASWGGVDIYLKSFGAGFDASSFTYEASINNIVGLSANDIRRIVRDPSTGALWLSVYNKGINICDDNRITLIDSDLLGLPSNKVSKIIIDDFVYVATDAGLGVYHTYEDLSFPLLINQYTNELTYGGLISDNIQDITLTDSDYLVMATDSGISYIHRDSLQFVESAWNTWTTANSILPNSIVTKVASKDDLLVFGTAGGLMIVKGFPNNIEFSTKIVFDTIIEPAISALFIDSDNQIWLSFGLWDEASMIYTNGFDKGIMKLSAQGTILQSWSIGDQNLDTINITSFQEIENVICASTWGEGLLFYTNDRWNKLKADCIGFNSIKTIETDHNNNMWFASGTYGDAMTKKGTRGVSSLIDNEWINYTVADSPLNSDNINTIAVDSHNNKWFGAWSAGSTNDFGWTGGLTVLDDTANPPNWYRFTTSGVYLYNYSTESYQVVDNTNGLYGSTVPYISVNDEGYVLVSCYDRGVSIYYPDSINYPFEKKEDIRVGDNSGQKLTLSHQAPDRYYFAINRTLEESGKLYYWDDSSLPNLLADPPMWDRTNISELNGCTVNAMESFTDPFGRQQFWVAANTGLFMYLSEAGSENGWYRWGTNKKREYWTGSSWSTSSLYYVDEERLFSSIASEPMSLFFDPFGVLWIGSNGAGISSYDPYS
ncbi:MAG: hypothetical protein JXR56_04085, partial [Candidatus Cloacimonetes bacterium]|nr:hypothetical protein [Candidatus Cloacimonadota bacterium]